MSETVRLGAIICFSAILLFSLVSTVVDGADQQAVAAVATTSIVIDGDPSDWEQYEPVHMDGRHDARGAVDFVGMRVFANDSYLYILVVVDEAGIGEYSQLAIDIPERRFPEFMAVADPGESILYLLHREDGDWKDIGPVGDLAVAEAFEMRVPLEAFGGYMPERVVVRVMGGECCGSGWFAIDATPLVEVVTVAETEMPFLDQARLDGPDSLFCKCEGQPGESPIATGIRVPSGYRAEYFIAPSGLNCPADVAVAPNGDIFVASTRAGGILRVSMDGTLSTYAEDVEVYAIDVDAQGQLYGYSYPDEEIYAISRGGARRIAHLPATACESTLAVAPDGTMYIGYNYCAGDEFGEATLYRISPTGGSPEILRSGMHRIAALDVNSQGNLYGVIDETLCRIDPDSGHLQTITSLLPSPLSHHGLAVADNGSMYISTGDFVTSGSIYRIAPGGKISELASFEGNGIEGIALAKDGSVVGTQRGIGGLQIIRPDGSVEALVKPNGLTSPQSLAFSPCGELLIVNDEAGWASVACPDGSVRVFSRMCSFQPPQTFIAFGQEGWFVAGESAPGFPSQLNVYLPNGRYRTIASDIDNVSGVAVAPDGTIYASATGAGRIVRVLPDGSRQTVVENLQLPQGLALASDGRLYAIVGGGRRSGVFAIPATGDTVVEVHSDGSIEELARIEHAAAALAIDEKGILYVAARDKVHRIESAWSSSTFASGFESARGLAFDAEGNLYVADDHGNCIVRVVMTGEQGTEEEHLESGSGTGPDRDGDGVPDDEDYCPDWPGNPETNGC